MHNSVAIPRKGDLYVLAVTTPFDGAVITRAEARTFE
jgi:hypothetical protein